VSVEVEEKSFEQTDHLLEYLRECANSGFTWFRGQSRANWMLQPQVCRDVRHNEHGLLKSFWQRSASFADAPSADDFAHWISLAQHYGVPTRALDWSESFLVALYFASCKPPLTEKDKPDDVDSAVWILNPVKLNRVVMGDLLTSSIAGTQEVAVCSEQDEPIIGHMMRAFGYIWGGKQYEYVAYSPQYRYLRMANQKAAFTWHHASAPLEESADASTFLKKITFPGVLRSRLIADLTMLGVTHSSLFPDFGGVAQELKSRGVGA
jgi:FRG domain